MNRSTKGATAGLVLVFAAGAAAGVALDRTWLSPEPDAGPETTRAKSEEEKPGHERTVIERFSEELELTRDQRARIDTILARYRDRMHEMWSEVRPRYRSLVDSARARIVDVLTDRQAERYRELLRREAEKREERWDRDERPESEDAGASRREGDR